MHQIKQHSHWILLLFLLFYGVVSLLVSAQESATFDEKAHIPAAYSYVRYGDMRINPEHPPLIKDLAGLPLLFLDVVFPLDTPEWQTGVNEQWRLGDMFMNCTDPNIACNDSEAILLWSRFPTTIIALLLGLFLFLWGREIGGTLAGLIATMLFVFDPNTLAHGHYVTTDIGIAAFIFFAFYFFVHFLKRPSWKNVILAGLFLGLAELTKFSSILLLPIFGLFTLVYALTKHLGNTKEVPHPRFRIVASYLGKYVAILVLCFTLIVGFYAVNTRNMPQEQTIAVSQYMFSPYTGVGENAAKRFARNSLETIVAIPGFDPIAHYLLGVFMVFSRVAGGNTFYFLGTISQDASLAYFPVLFGLKETLPLIFFLILTLSYGFFRIGKMIRGKLNSDVLILFAASFQERIAQYLAFFFILFYSYISITGNLNIGFRHLFPILPFIYLLIGKTAADFYQRNKDEAGYLIRPLFAVLVAIVISIPLSVYPHYLSYYNPLAGGNQNGYMIATDSNYDWGQDLKRLSDFIDTHNRCVDIPDFRCDSSLSSLPKIDTIRLDYFGGSNPNLYMKDRYTNWYAAKDPEPGWYAISVVFLQEGIFKSKEPGQRGYEWLSTIGEVTRAGDSIFIFYVQPDAISAPLSQE